MRNMMKLSELLARGQEALERHGDMGVYFLMEDEDERDARSAEAHQWVNHPDKIWVFSICEKELTD